MSAAPWLACLWSACALAACGEGGSGGAGGGAAGGAGGAAGGAGGSAGGAGGSGAAGECLVADDCAGSGGALGECAVPTCSAGACGVAFVAEGTLAGPQAEGDCMASACDGSGGLTSFEDASDPLDDANPCTTDTCTPAGTVHTPKPLDAPCPTGVCDGQGSCAECNEDADCTGEICLLGVCVPIGCQDGVKDLAETGVDCGGPVCGKCGPGEGCVGAADCQGGDCQGGLCAPTCTDLVKSGVETGADCGGPTCGACPLGEGCAVDADCASGFCDGAQHCSLLNGCDKTTAEDHTADAVTNIAFAGISYAPPCVVVKLGSDVTFDGDFPAHPLLSASVESGVKIVDAAGPFQPITNTGLTKTFTMSATGPFGYVCDFHWPLGMTGAVFVVP